MGFLGSTDPDLFPTKIEITGYPRPHIQGSGGAPIKNNLSHLQSTKPLFQTVYLFAMKKFLLFAFAAVMLGFAGCNDDENKDNIPPTLREYEAPVFMYGKTREEVKASVPYAYSGASETSLYFEGKGIVKEYIYIRRRQSIFLRIDTFRPLHRRPAHLPVAAIHLPRIPSGTKNVRI